MKENPARQLVYPEPATAPECQAFGRSYQASPIVHSIAIQLVTRLRLRVAPSLLRLASLSLAKGHDKRKRCINSNGHLATAC